MNLNPGSTASFEVDSEGVFSSLFFYLSAVEKVLGKAGFPTLAVDGTHSRHVFYKHNGLALFLVGRTSDNKLLVLAFMICDKENGANYTMFAKKCKQAGLGDLLDAAESFDGQKVGCRGDRYKVNLQNNGSLFARWLPKRPKSPRAPVNGRYGVYFRFLKGVAVRRKSTSMPQNCPVPLWTPPSLSF